MIVDNDVAILVAACSESGRQSAPDVASQRRVNGVEIMLLVTRHPYAETLVGAQEHAVDRPFTKTDAGRAELASSIVTGLDILLRRQQREIGSIRCA